MITIMEGITEVKIVEDKVVSLDICENGTTEAPWRLEINLVGKYGYVLRFKTKEELDVVVKEIESKL